jgi:hypothetical protein
LFCEYETYNGGEFFLGDDSTTIIIGEGKLSCFSRRIRIVSGVLHIPYLDRNLIYESKMSDEGVPIVFEEET